MYTIHELCQHIIYYSNQKDYEISAMKLHGLLFFCQIYFLRVEHRVYFNEPFLILDCGVCLQSVYDRYGYSSSSLFAQEDTEGLDSEAVACLDQVTDCFAEHWGSQVSDYVMATTIYQWCRLEGKAQLSPSDMSYAFSS